MEQITKFVENINLNSGFKVGVFYHEDMLLHKSPGRHPENPDRLSSILNHLKNCKLFDDCKMCTEFGTIDRNLLIDFHGEEYVNLIENIWDEASKKEVRFYKDTYYNKHTPRIASLAANAIRLAVDDIMSGKIQRAFGIVRPPGHHAAAKHGIGGFCIYNNVAIAAKYAIKKYNLKRVVIFDWDVHHGDGTSKFLYNDASILYISIHRFDNGNFYPGEFGDIKNLGEGEGKGFNLNYPWNLPHPYYTIGDDEYIYALERVFIPIIKKFDPELVFISAGFDAACGDPLGGLDVSPDGYAYMTQRLLDIAPTKTIIGLEGGYNLDSISKAAEACLRILLSQEMPLQSSENGLSFKEMKEKCCPNEVGIQTAVLAVENFQEHWPALNIDEEALQFEKEVKANTLKRDKNVIKIENYIIKQDKFLRKVSKDVLEIYEELKMNQLESNKNIVDFFPKYLGSAKIDGHSYVILENLLFTNPKSSIIQIKLCQSSSEGGVKKENNNNEEYKAHNNQKDFLSSLILKDEKGNIALQKEFFHSQQDDPSDEIISNILLQFFTVKENKIDPKVLDTSVNFLNELYDFINHKNSMLWERPSLLFILDKSKQEFKASWISFKASEKLADGTKDTDFLAGIQKLLKILQNLNSKDY